MSLLAPLRLPAFRRLFVARTVTYLGNAVAPVALGFAVLDLTGSATDLGLVVGARSVANVALLQLGGEHADPAVVATLTGTAPVSRRARWWNTAGHAADAPRGSALHRRRCGRGHRTPPRHLHPAA